MSPEHAHVRTRGPNEAKNRRNESDLLLLLLLPLPLSPLRLLRNFTPRNARDDAIHDEHRWRGGGGIDNTVSPFNLLRAAQCSTECFVDTGSTSDAVCTLMHG